jgi:hypothetical protein
LEKENQSIISKRESLNQFCAIITESVTNLEGGDSNTERAEPRSFASPAQPFTNVNFHKKNSRIVLFLGGG